jgi:beta-glucosidase
VRESLVLLKNDRRAAAGARQEDPGGRQERRQHADQTGGWSLTWQGTDNKNSDFPNADTILAGIVAPPPAPQRDLQRRCRDVDVEAFDVVVAVIGENAVCRRRGDIGPSGTLRHSGRYPEDLAVLQAVAGKGKPVVTVLVAGRPLYTNDLMNLSDSFVAAWLPGTEGKGVADVLASKGVDLGAVEAPFVVSADKPFAAAFTQVRIAAKADKAAGVVDCK